MAGTQLIPAQGSGAATAPAILPAAVRRTGLRGAGAGSSTGLPVTTLSGSSMSTS